jgi:hypothetical protein
MLDGEAEALTRRALDLALDGDPTALRLSLDRIVAPRRECGLDRDGLFAEIAARAAALTKEAAPADPSRGGPA